ncbi:MAG: right-handed parallel beta-helix repeat-containing protein [Promethearchaeota archaeon]
MMIFIVSCFLMFFQASDTRMVSRLAVGICRDVEHSDGVVMRSFHVSLDGNDSWSGNETFPFRTVGRAQQAVRGLASNMTGDIIVYIHGGVYYLDSTLEFNESDGGSGGYNVIYENYNDEDVVLSGGKRITGWATDDGKVWHVHCDVQDFRQFYVNDRRVVRARGDVTFIKDSTGDGLEANDNRMESWSNIQEVEFVFKREWTLPRIRVDRVDENKIYMQQPAYYLARNKPGVGIKSPEWIENAYSLLDEPGEWYLDKSADTLYYIPRDGEYMANATTIVPVLEEIIKIDGDSSNIVNNLQFIGLSFQHGSWLRPNQYSTCHPDVQANVILMIEDHEKKYEMSPGNIVMKYAEHVSFINCSFIHLGTTALDLQEGTRYSRIIGNVFKDISGTGIQVGSIKHSFSDLDDPRYVKNIDIINNYITNCCVEYMGGCGIFTGYVRNVRIEHNTLSNLPYTGISVGWGWSSKVTVLGNNSIKYNLIYAVMTYLHDGGGIYTLSTQPGTNVSYNVIHDSGHNGLYPDERTNQTTWTFNVVYDTFNSFLDHTMYEESRWNVVKNNYLETYPKYLWVWYPDRDDDQIWGLRPGDEGFPQDILSQAGLEQQYQHLVPLNESYWHYTSENELKRVADDYTLSLGMIMIMILGCLGVYYIYRTRSRPNQQNRDDALLKGGNHEGNE